MKDSHAAPPLAPPIFTIREEPAILDADLAVLYGVTTKVFNQAVKRNARRFPPDFMFRLTASEWRVLRSQIVTLKMAGRGRHRKYLPLAFTEHGAIMAASVLNSQRATAMSVYIVRAFVRLRRESLVNASLEVRLQRIEKDLLIHDAALRDILAKIRPLLLPPPDPARRAIGFHVKDEL